jgi:hypothetical protein
MSRTGYPGGVADRVWTAIELEAMSPVEQDDLFNASIVTDLDEVPAEFLARVRARLAERTGTAGVESPTQP